MTFIITVNVIKAGENFEEKHEFKMTKSQMLVQLSTVLTFSLNFITCRLFCFLYKHRFRKIKFLDFIQHLILACIIFSLLLNLGNEAWNLHPI